MLNDAKKKKNTHAHVVVRRLKSQHDTVTFHVNEAISRCDIEPDPAAAERKIKRKILIWRRIPV